MDEYKVEYIEPIETISYKDEYLKKMIKDLNEVSNKIIESHNKLSGRIETVIHAWTDFIKYLKDMKVDEKDEDNDQIIELISQNKVLMDQNHQILEMLESIENKHERTNLSTRAQSSFGSRRYPKIRVTK